MRIWLVLLAPLLLLTACASVTGSSTQTITVNAVCEGMVVSKASCALTNDKGTWTVKSASSVKISKSFEKLSVSCEKDGVSGQNTYVSKSTDGAWGNILVGGGIGYVIDAGSGSGFDYPQKVTVVLEPPCS